MSFCLLRRFIQRSNMKQHIRTHRIELMQDQKPGFTVGKNGRSAASHSEASLGGGHQEMRGPIPGLPNLSYNGPRL